MYELTTAGLYEPLLQVCINHYYRYVWTTTIGMYELTTIGLYELTTIGMYELTTIGMYELTTIGMYKPLLQVCMNPLL